MVDLRGITSRLEQSITDTFLQDKVEKPPVASKRDLGDMLITNVS